MTLAVMMDLETQIMVGMVVGVFCIMQGIFISEKRKERKWQPEAVVLPPAKLPKLLGDLEDKLPAFSHGTNLRIESWHDGNLRVELSANQVRLLHSGLPKKTLQDIYG